MYTKALIIASVASLAVAQSSTASAATSSPSCAGQNILDACKATIQSQINSCSTTDYSCLCTGYTNYVGCYANSGCSSDPTIGTAQQEKELNCNNASVYGSTTTLGVASATSAATSASTSSEGAVQTGFGSGTSSGSSSSASSTSSANSAEKVKNAGGLLAIVAAGIAALL